MNILEKSLIATYVCMGLTPVTATADGEDEKAITAWVQGEALSLSPSLQLGEGARAWLHQALSGKRVVFLGEPDHFIQEKYAFRESMIRFLRAEGWSVLGAEMGRSDAMRVDRYLASGQDTELERAGIFGYQGFLREDRSDIPATGGIVAATAGPDVASRLREQERGFFATLAAENLESPPYARLRYFGFDIDTVAGGGYEDIDARLDGRPAGDEGTATLRQLLSRVPGESAGEEAARLARATALVSTFGEPALAADLACLQASFTFIDRAYPTADLDKLVAALTDRERTMMTLMDEELRALGPDTKIILIGHNMHLSKDFHAIASGKAGATSSTMWPTIGAYLESKLPGEVLSLWMLYHRGFHSAPCSDAENEHTGCALPDHSDSIERLFSAARPGPFLLPLQDASGASPASLRTVKNFNFNGLYAHGILSQVADAIFFVPEVTALQGAQ